MRHQDRLASIRDRQRVLNAKQRARNQKYLSMSYIFSHVEISIVLNVILLAIVAILKFVYNIPHMDLLLCIIIISIMFHGVIAYRKHTSY